MIINLEFGSKQVCLDITKKIIFNTKILKCPIKQALHRSRKQIFNSIDRLTGNRVKVDTELLIQII